MRLDQAILPGLGTEASITIDTWGIPHIRAASKRDVFLVQGYNAARDRLWQIDLWRKRGLGLLAADFGPGYLEQDRAARLFLYRGDMQQEWDAYSPDAEEIAAAFVDGINAYIDHVDRHPDLMPPEFGIFGTRPQRWSREDVVRIRSHSLMRNALSEVIRANVMSGASADVDLLRRNLQPTREPVIPDGITLGDIPIEVLDTFKLALAAVSFEEERLQAKPSDALRWRKVAATGEVVQDTTMQGSNNWVIAGNRTKTGRPILANDPHRAHAIPSLRYLVHLTCPEFDVIGAGEPCVPGISIGHNGTSAFGLTLFFGHDQEDVYVYETSPDDPDLYRYGDGWERVVTLTEDAAVRGHESAAFELRFTRHGPIVYEDRARRRAYAIRSVWFDAGTAPYFKSIASMHSTSFAAFRQSMRGWGVPATNQVYADTTGAIGWVVAGFSPIRPNWDGLLPVPGDGRYEWQGYLPADELPYSFNPPKGYFATANEYNLPADWPHAQKQIGYEWLEPSRANRIEEVLSRETMGTIASSGALQADDLSLPARRLTHLVIELSPDVSSPNLARAVLLFVGWNHRLGIDSGAAALFEVWWSKHLRPVLFRLVAGDAKLAALLQPGDVSSILALLENPDARLGADPVRTRTEIVAETLISAFKECAERMGPDESVWRWGALHHGYFEHAASPISEGSLQLDVGPVEKGGSDSTPMNATYRASDFRVTHGASLRVVIDVGSWDDSVCINSPGQSGDPYSPHYGDLAAIWARGGFVPLLYSAALVDAASRHRIELTPAGDSRPRKG